MWRPRHHGIVEEPTSLVVMGRVRVSPVGRPNEMTPESSLHRSLLLLPPPPRPNVNGYQWPDLRHTYGPALSTALSSAAKSGRQTGQGAIVDVALPCRELGQGRQLPRSQVYSNVQTLLAGIYKLICVVCAQEDIDTGVRGGLDARVLTLSWDDGDDDDDDQKTAHPNLSTLARSERAWRTVFSVDDESGHQILQRFRDRARTRTSSTTWDLRLVDRGERPSGDDRSPLPSVELDATCKRHHRVAVGGTFDHLHAGHKLLLTMSALLLEPDGGHDHQGRHLTVGISGDELLRDKAFAEYVDPWEQRQADVADFIAAITDFSPPGRQGPVVTSTAGSGVGPRAMLRRLDGSLDLACIEITDPYGPTITDPDISALVISKETRPGARAVNQRRQEKGWHALDVFEVDVLVDDDNDDEEGPADESRKTEFTGKVSSTEIRRRLSERSHQAINPPSGASSS